MSDDTVMIEEAELVFRNFAGKEGPFNEEGTRSVCVILPPELASQMTSDGWNVKQMKPRLDDDGNPEPTRFYINVAVSYKIKPPTIVMMTSKARTKLTEDTVETLDWANIKVADIIFRPRKYDVRGESGTKAYLQSLYVTIDEDALERKYAIDPED